MDVDDVIGVDGGVDDVGVGAVLAVEIDGVGDLTVEAVDRRQRGHGRHVEDMDRVVARSGVDVGHGRKRRRAELDVVRAAAGIDIELRGGERAGEADRHAVAVELRRHGEIARLQDYRRPGGQLRRANDARGAVDRNVVAGVDRNRGPGLKDDARADGDAVDAPARAGARGVEILGVQCYRGRGFQLSAGRRARRAVDRDIVPGAEGDRRPRRLDGHAGVDGEVVVLFRHRAGLLDDRTARQHVFADFERARSQNIDRALGRVERIGRDRERRDAAHHHPADVPDPDVSGGRGRLDVVDGADDAPGQAAAARAVRADAAIGDQVRHVAVDVLTVVRPAVPDAADRRGDESDGGPGVHRHQRDVARHFGEVDVGAAGRRGHGSRGAIGADDVEGGRGAADAAELSLAGVERNRVGVDIGARLGADAGLDAGIQIGRVDEIAGVEDRARRAKRNVAGLRQDVEHVEIAIGLIDVDVRMGQRPQIARLAGSAERAAIGDVDMQGVAVLADVPAGLELEPVGLDFREVRAHRVVDGAFGDEIDAAGRRIDAADGHVAVRSVNVDVVQRARRQRAVVDEVDGHRRSGHADVALARFEDDIRAFDVNAAGRGVDDVALGLDPDVLAAGRNDVGEREIDLRADVDEAARGRRDRPRRRDRYVPALRDQDIFDIARAVDEVDVDRRHANRDVAFASQSLAPLKGERLVVGADRGDRVISIGSASVEARAVAVRVGGGLDIDPAADLIARSPGSARQRDRAVVRHVAEADLGGGHGRSQCAFVGRAKVDDHRGDKNGLAGLRLDRLGEGHGRTADRLHLEIGAVLGRVCRAAADIKVIARLDVETGPAPARAVGERHRIGAEIDGLDGRRGGEEVEVGKLRRRQGELGGRAVGRRAAWREADLIGHRIDERADIAVGGLDDDVGRRDVRGLDRRLRARRRLQETGADPAQELGRRPHLDAGGQVGLFRRGEQIGEVRVVDVGIVGVDRHRRVRRGVVDVVDARTIGPARTEHSGEVVVLLRRRQFERLDSVGDEGRRRGAGQPLLLRLSGVDPGVIRDVGGRHLHDAVDQRVSVRPIGLILLLLVALVLGQRGLDLGLRLGAGERQLAPYAVLELGDGARIHLHVGVDVDQTAVVDSDVGDARRRQREQRQIALRLFDIDVPRRGQIELIGARLADGELDRRVRRADAAAAVERHIAAGDQPRVARRHRHGAERRQAHRLIAAGGDGVDPQRRLRRGDVDRAVRRRRRQALPGRARQNDVDRQSLRADRRARDESDLDALDRTGGVRLGDRAAGGDRGVAGHVGEDAEQRDAAVGRIDGDVRPRAAFEIDLDR